MRALWVVVVVGCAPARQSPDGGPRPSNAREVAARAPDAAPRPVDATPPPVAAPPALAFRVTQGRRESLFLQRGPVAAQVVVTSGPSPRVLVAFPAGDAAAALWLYGPAKLKAEDPVEVVEGAAHGLRVDLHANASRLMLRPPLLGPTAQVATSTAPVSTAEALGRWSRAGLSLRVTPLPPTTLSLDARGVPVLAAPAHEGLSFTLTATTAAAPRRPIASEGLLLGGAAARPLARHTLSFLAYEGGLLAGGWRGFEPDARDTLLSLCVAMGVLTAQVVEAGLGPVLDAVDAQGAVPGPSWEDDLLLSSVVARYLLDLPSDKGRAAALLSPTRRAALDRNAARVLALAAPYAADPGPRTLLQPPPAAQWRGADGLFGGGAPYGLNVALLPAALEAVRRLAGAGLISPRPRVAEISQAWADVGRRFEVRLGAARAQRAAARYAKARGVPAVEVRADLRFPAVALSARGRPVPVPHTEVGLMMVLTAPDAGTLEAVASTLIRAFPAGLWTPVGVVGASPAFLRRAQWARGGPDRPTGAVMGRVQHALLLAGLRRQRARAELPAELRRQLAEAELAVRSAAAAAGALAHQARWTWRWQAGFKAARFGVGAGRLPEPDAVRLTDVMWLAVPEATR